MKKTLDQNKLTIVLEGRVTSSNAQPIQQEIEQFIASNVVKDLVLDGTSLDYISSAGLRIIFTLRNRFPHLEIVNVNLEVYDILNMTGFTQLITIHRKLAEIDVTGMQIIGEGGTGIVYRMDKDTILKVYKRDLSIKDIEKEMNLCKSAFVLGIPTAITYDVVKVGNRFASRFEMLDCDTLGEVILKHPKQFESYLDLYADLLLKINSTSSPDLVLPNKKEQYIEHAKLCAPYLDKEKGDKLISLMENVPDRNTFIHGDCHVKNIMSDGSNIFLIDMATLSMGYPIFELGALYRTFYGFDFIDPGNAERFLELPRDILDKMFEGVMRRYLLEYNEKILDKLALTGCCYLLSWGLRHEKDPEKRVEDTAKRLTSLIDRVDDLTLPLKEYVEEK